MFNEQVHMHAFKFQILFSTGAQFRAVKELVIDYYGPIQAYYY